MEKLKATKEVLEDALDQINSSRSSSDARTLALRSVERCLAQGLSDEEQRLEHFLALQYTFECNVPLRLLSWLSLATTQLDTLVKGRTDEHLARQVDSLASQIALSLSLIQGIALSHPSSKVFLARCYPQEVLLDLLLASRHLPLAAPADVDTNECRKQGSTEPPLTSLVLDTLLCVLVDSSSALRMFEVVGGPQAVVRILKRSTTPREVRMKCLEFLYFYLLDETIPTSEEREQIRQDLAQASPQKPQRRLEVPAPPSTPARLPSPSKPRLTATPLRPSSASFANSSMLSVSSGSSSGTSSRSTSNGSTMSFSSTSSNSTTASSVASSPEKPCMVSRSDPAPPAPSRSPQKRSTSITPKGLGAGPTKHAQILTTPPSSPPPLDPVRSKYRFPRTPVPSLSAPDAPKIQITTRLQPKANRASALSPKAISHSNSGGVLRPKGTMLLQNEVDYEPMSPEKPTMGTSNADSTLSSKASSHTFRPLVIPSTPLTKPTASPGHSKSKSTSMLGHGKPGTLSRQRDPRKDIRESLGKEGGKGLVKAARLHSAESVRSGELGPKPSFLEEHGLPPIPASPQKKQRNQVQEAAGKENRNPKDREEDREKKTTEEKKQLLGTMLGNVDALVEGVRKAGIWGLA